MEEQQTPTAGTPIYQESSQEKSAKWLWLLIVLIIIGALGFAYWKGIGPFAKFRLGNAQASPSPTPFSFPTPSPESSPEASLNKSEAKIRVLNGTTTTGLAASVQDFLEGKGWTVSSIGNAANKNFTNTVVRFKEGFDKFEDLLVDDLSDKYSVTVSTDELEATDSADIEVTVGSK